MPRTKRLRDVAVILAALIGVANQEANWRACRYALEHAREDFNRVVLLALRHMPRSAGLAPIQIGLNILGGQRHSRRTAVNDATNGRPVRFTKRGDREEMTEGVSRHLAILEVQRRNRIRRCVVSYSKRLEQLTDDEFVRRYD